MVLTVLLCVVVVLVIVAVVFERFGWFTQEKAPSNSNGTNIVDDERTNTVKVEDELWLSDKGILHNSLCRWYKYCDGKVWDGTAEYSNCGRCGGTDPIVHEYNLPDWKKEDKKEEENA